MFNGILDLIDAPGMNRYYFPNGIGKFYNSLKYPGVAAYI